MVSPLGFTKSQRLLNAHDFKAVFDHADYRVSHGQMLLLSRKNNLNYPRLGLVIAKKNAKLAVQRNRIKRIIRESFRLHQQQLPAVDIIVLARRGIDSLDNSQLQHLTAKSWQRLIHRASDEKR